LPRASGARPTVAGGFSSEPPPGPRPASPTKSRSAGRRSAGKAYIPTTAEQTLANNIEDYWGSLAATGSPATGALGWPVYAQPSEQVLTLDTTLSAGKDVRPTKCNFWDSLYPAGSGG